MLKVGFGKRLEHPLWRDRERDEPDRLSVVEFCGNGTWRTTLWIGDPHRWKSVTLPEAAAGGKSREGVTGFFLLQIGGIGGRVGGCR